MKCSFCGGEMPKGAGKMYVKSDGKIFYFCSSKCNKNYLLGRDGKLVKWTQRFKKIREEEAHEKTREKKAE